MGKYNPARTSPRDRIVKTGGTARQAFLENEIIFPQLLFQETRPALIFIETAVIRSTVPVGIGISVAYNVFFMMSSS